jgi:hypothetical protein
MIRLALAVLAGATIVAAQVPQTTGADVGDNTGRPDFTTMKNQGGEGMPMNIDSLKEKFADRDTTGMGQKIQDAMDKWGSKIDSAREASVKTRGEFTGKPDCDTGKVMGVRDSTKRERLQGAIDALDRNSTRMGTQVKDVQEKTQIRMTERRDEMIQKQQRIRERKAEQDAAKTTEPKVDVPVAE